MFNNNNNDGGDDSSATSNSLPITRSFSLTEDFFKKYNRTQEWISKRKLQLQLVNNISLQLLVDDNMIMFENNMSSTSSLSLENERL